MIVADASVGIELLLQTTVGSTLAERVLSDAESVHVPELFDVEVAQVIRRYWRRGELAAGRATVAIADLADLPWTRHGQAPLMQRVWALRENATAYDAAYIALAEALDCPLLTRDRALASIRTRATIELV